LLAIPLGGCFVDRPCASRPNDPLCQNVDSGLPPSDAFAGGSDMGTACVPPCSGSNVCDTTSGLCVACLANTDCTTAAAAACDTTAHTCGACTTSQQCAHLTATPACHSGTCVQCNTNDDCDTTHACDTTMHRCVPSTPASKQVCDACLRDSECQTGQLCVPMTFHGAALGSFCQWKLDTTRTGMDCLNVRPFSDAVTATSVDGVTMTVCTLRSTTCDALAHVLMSCTAPTTPNMPEPACGANSDGFCQHQGNPTSGINQCTVGCATNTDCPCMDGTCAMQYKCMGGFCVLGQLCTWNSGNRTCT
jgi:hypothetical protein